MRKSVFAIDASPHAYIGYTSGRTWNGWATPYFTYEEAQKLQAEFSEGAGSPMLYDVTKDEFRLKYEDDDEVRDGLVEETIHKLADLDVLVKVYKAMNDDSLDQLGIYTSLFTTLGL